MAGPPIDRHAGIVDPLPSPLLPQSLASAPVD